MNFFRDIASAIRLLLDSVNAVMYGDRAQIQQRFASVSFKIHHKGFSYEFHEIYIIQFILLDNFY